jgi:hypothetical protein
MNVTDLSTKDVVATAERRAREIIKRISDAALEMAFMRHSLTSDEVDVDEDADIKTRVQAVEAFCEEVREDTFNCLTGDETGCLDPEDLDETNCELIWLQGYFARRDAVVKDVVEALRAVAALVDVSTISTNAHDWAVVLTSIREIADKAFEGVKERTN